MKTSTRIILTLAAVAAFSSVADAQFTLAKWTFENTTIAGATDTTTYTYGPADEGISIVGSSGGGQHASSATDWSYPAGNASARALTSNNWAVNDYWQFTLSTIDYQNLTVSFAQFSSSTGPANFSFQYSTNGTTYTTFGSAITVPNSAWTTSSFNLSSVPSLNDASNVYFRVVNTTTTAAGGGSVGTAGASRIDDFTVSGTAIPEPSTYAMMALGAVLLVGMQRMRRRS